MDLSNIKNIIFDFGFVLIDLDKQRCVEAFQEIGAAEIAKYVDEQRSEDLFHDLELGKITAEEFCDEARCRIGKDVSNEDIFGAWNALLAGIPSCRLQKIVALRERHRLFLLSNTNVIHWETSVKKYFPHAGKGVDDYFEHCFLSYEMNLLKPHAEIYLKVLEKAGIRAEETLFIDDSARNCEGAEVVGIKTLNVSHGDQWLEVLDELL